MPEQEASSTSTAARYHALRAIIAEIAARPDELKSILDASAVPFVAFDASRRIQHANRAGAAFFGYGPGELDGKSTDEVVPPRLRQPDAPPMVPSPEIIQIDLPGLRRDGSELLVEWQLASLPSPEGHLFVMEVRDRGQLDRAEAALRASEERFRLLVDGVKDYALFMLDPDGRIVTWNAGAARIKGWREDEILGQHYEIFFTAEDRARNVPRELLARAAADGRVETTGVRQRKDGSPFRVHGQLTALREADGTLRGFAKLTRDLTERVLAEEHLSAERAQREAAEAAERRIRASEEQLAGLQRITAALSRAATPLQVAEVALGEGLDAVGAQGGAVFAVDDDRQELVLVAQRGHPEESGAAFQRVPLAGSGPITDAANQKRSLFFESREASAQRYPHLREAIAAGGFEASAALPMIAHGRVMGVLGVRFRRSEVTPEPRRTFLMAVANVCAQALERARLFAAERSAREDAATRRDQLQRYFWHTPTPLAVYEGRDHRFVLANPPYRALFGNRPLEGLPVREALPEIAATGIFEHMDRVFQTGERVDLAEFHAPLPRADGGVADRWFNLSIEPVRSDGVVTGLVAAGFEVTAQVEARRIVEAAHSEAKRANEVAEGARRRLQALVDEMPVGVVLVDWPSGEVVLANPQVERLLKRPIDRNVRDFAAWTVYRADGSPHPVDEWPLARAMRTGAAVSNEELQVVLSDGSRVWFSCGAAPIRDAAGRITGALLLFDDVTARKRAEVALRESEDRERTARADAEAANRAKDEFLAMLGHELRNPLSPMVTAVQLMRLRGGDAFEKERSVIERQVAHLTRLVDDLLDISRITRGKVELQVQRVEIAEVIAKALELASPLLEQRRHHVRLDVPTRGLAVDGDVTRLSQVISNLLTNAARYTPPRGHIDISAGLARERVVVRVRDDGIGIAPQMMPRIFDLFVQGSQDLARSEGGLGLGLAIVRSLVARHGGSVSARSEGPGKGSEFAVELPAAPLQEAPPAARLPLLRPPRVTGRRVLVVDDNRDAAELLAEFLRANGNSIAMALDGSQALQAVRDFRPDAALLDIGLPVMDGYELARRLRELFPDVHLVAVTGYGQEAERRRAREAGFDDHLVKPVRFDVLEEVLSRPARA